MKGIEERIREIVREEIIKTKAKEPVVGCTAPIEIANNLALNLPIATFSVGNWVINVIKPYIDFKMPLSNVPRGPVRIVFKDDLWKKMVSHPSFNSYANQFKSGYPEDFANGELMFAGVWLCSEKKQVPTLDEVREQKRNEWNWWCKGFECGLSARK